MQLQGADSNSELIYRVRFGVVAKYFGDLCLVLAALTLVPILSSFLFHQPLMAFRYIVVFSVYMCIGLGFRRLPEPRRLQANEGMVVVVLGFVFACLITAFPIMSENFTFIDAVFETVAGISTTGLSTLPSVIGATDSFVFQRAWMEWYGALGFVTLCLVLLMRSGLTSKIMTGGDESADIVGGAKAHAHRAIRVICIMSLIGAIGAWLLGMDVFNAVVFSLTSVATGGLSPTDSGVGGLNAPLQIWISLLCIAGAAPLTIYYQWINKNRYFAVELLQVKVLIISCIIVTCGITICTAVHSDMSMDYILQNVPLLAIQAQTTAGFTTIQCANLDPGSKLILICSMLTGGCVGSTAGGIKILRVLLIIAIIKATLQKISMSRHAVVSTKFANLKIGTDNVISALILIVMFFMVIITSWFMFLFMGYQPIDSLFEVVAAITNAGISVGVTNVNLPTALKIVLCVDMIFGRLEIAALLITLFPGTWFGKRREERRRDDRIYRCW